MLTVLLFAILSMGIGCSRAPQTSDQDQSEQSSAETQVPAQAGVGKQGQKLKDREGLFATPAKALFNTRQLLTFQQAEQALKLHSALEGYPKSHQEYMQIMERNFITLPELPTGQRYKYNPETKVLMVIKPAGQ